MSESRNLYSEAATRLFSDLCPADVPAAAETDGYPRELWAAVETAGFASMLASEEDGGVSASPAEAVALLKVAGRFAVPLPLAETLIAQWVLSLAGVKVGPGPLTVALSEGDGPWTFTQRSGRTTLKGQQRAVPWAASATAVVVVAPHKGKSAVAVVAPGKFKIEARKNIAGEPRDDIVAEAVEADAFAELAAPGPRMIFRMASLFRAALISGALERILDMSVRYSTERSQFGRTLSRFQAIQQQLAVLAGEAAASAAIADAAACVVEREDGELMIAVARARLAAAIDTGAAVAHQVHGAIGFSREYPLHNHTRRLWAWRDEYGSAVEWRERLGRAFAGTPADALWPKLARVGARTE